MRPHDLLIHPCYTKMSAHRPHKYIFFFLFWYTAILTHAQSAHGDDSVWYPGRLGEDSDSLRNC